MRKRVLTLDKERLTDMHPGAQDGAALWGIITSILGTIGAASQIEPEFCECMGTDSCGSAACATEYGTECIPDASDFGCVTFWQGCSMQYC